MNFNASELYIVYWRKQYNEKLMQVFGDIDILSFVTIYFVVQQPLMGQVLLIIEVSRSHSDTPNSVGLLWTSDRPVAETST
jgi:hypothetical protein